MHQLVSESPVSQQCPHGESLIEIRSIKFMLNTMTRIITGTGMLKLRHWHRDWRLGGKGNLLRLS